MNMTSDNLPHDHSDKKVQTSTSSMENPDTAGDPVDTMLDQDPDFWFDDGNVVLVAGKVMFRVHRGILSRHSEIFRDMFGLATGDRSAQEFEYHEGCPVVHLSDSSVDLRYILSALYDGGKRTFIYDSPLPICAVSAMLRLGTKYEMQHLIQEAICRLKKSFPCRLEDFRNNAVLPREEGIPSFCHSHAVAFKLQNAIMVVNLARSYNLEYILPPAFYLCAQLSVDKLVYGITDEDGRHWKLDPHDLILCMKGVTDLEQAGLRSLAALLLPPSGKYECSNLVTCSGSRRRILQALLRDKILAHPNALLKGVAWINDHVEPASYALCITCQGLLERTHKEHRQRTWNSLGEMFAVSPWPPIEVQGST